MTIKCLSDAQQTEMAFNFANKLLNLEELSFIYGVSRRTVMRVLTEKNVAPFTHKRVHKPKQQPLTVQIGLDEIKVPYPKFPEAKAPWFHRFLQSLVRLTEKVLH